MPEYADPLTPPAPDLSFSPSLTASAAKIAGPAAPQLPPSASPGAPTPEDIAASAPAAPEGTPSAADVAASSPVTDFRDAAPAAEDVKASFKQFTPDDVAKTPVMDLTKDREFNPVQWAIQNPEAATDPKVLQSLAEVYRQRKLAGVTMADVGEGLKGIPGAVGSLAKAALARAANIKDIFFGARGGGPSQEKAEAESAAAMESAGFGAVNMARGAGQKWLHNNPIGRLTGGNADQLWENMPDAELRGQFFNDVGIAGQAAKAGSGEGALMMLHNSPEELAKRGIVLDPKNIEALTLTDPLTWAAFEGGFKIVNAATGAVLGTAASAAGAQAAIQSIKSAASTATRQVVGQGARAAGAVASGIGKITEKAGAAGIPIALMKLAEGEVKQAAIIGGSALSAPLLKGAGKFLSESGQNLVSGAPLATGVRRLADLGSAGANALADVGKGAAVGAGTALATSESPEDTQNLISFGGAFALPHAIKSAAGRVVAGELVQPKGAAVGPTRSAAYGEYPVLDKITSDTLAGMEPDRANKINFARELARKLGAQVYAYATPEQGAQMISAAKPGTSPEAAAAAAKQNGFTLDVNGKSVVFLNGAADASGHELGHVLEKALTPEQNNKLDAATQSQFSPEEWDHIGRDYTQRLLKRDLQPGENWRDALAPAAGDLGPDKYMLRESRADNFDELFKNRGSDIGKPEDVYRRIVGALGRGAEAVGAPLVQANDFSGNPVSLRSQHASDLALGKALPEITPKGAEPKTAGPTPKPDAIEKAKDFITNNPTGLPERDAGMNDLLDATRQGKGRRVLYWGAKGDPAGNVTSVRPERRAEIEKARGEENSKRQLMEKEIFPYKVDNTSKGPQIVGWSPDNFEANQEKLGEWLGQQSRGGADVKSQVPYGFDPASGRFTAAGRTELNADAQKFMRNQAAGFTGSGKPVIVPKELAAGGKVFEPARSGAPPEPLDQNRADLINYLFHVQIPDSASRVAPLHLAAQDVAAASGRPAIEPVRPRGEYTQAQLDKAGIAGPRAPMEVNPFRQWIEQTAQDTGIARPSLIDVSQRLNVNHIEKTVPSLRTEPFGGNTLTLAAGFQPSAHPDAVKVGAAVRDDETGTIYKGVTHYHALEQRMRDRFPRYSAESAPAFTPGARTEGFLTNKGDFLDRQQAQKRAEEFDQIPENMFGRDRGLESTMFEHYNTNFVPDITPPTGGGEEPRYNAQGKFQGSSGAQYQPPLHEINRIVSMPDDEMVKYAQGTPRFQGEGVKAGLGLNTSDVTKLEELRDAQTKVMMDRLHKGDVTSPEMLAAQSRMIWLNGAIEGANKKGGNYDAVIAKEGEQPVEGAAQPPARNADVNAVAEDYAKSAGRVLKPATYAVLDPEHAKSVADYYQSASHDPKNEAVKSSYDALAKETETQYKAIEAAGYKMEPFTGTGEPYKTSADMVADVTDNKHLFYLPSASASEASTDNLMMRPSGIDGRPVNDIFRAVHDFFGHAKEGYQFGPRGEYNAWREHSQMYSPEAQGALAAETLAQNAWVNFGPHLRDGAGNVAAKGEPGYVAPASRPFAEQKNIVVPPEVAGQAQPKQRDENKMLSGGPGGFSNAWILPGGKVAQLGGQWHHDFLASDPEGIAAAKKAGLKVPTFEGSDDANVRPDALKKGFARVKLDRNNGIFTVEARAVDWNKQKAQVEKMVESNLPDIDNIRVHLLNRTADELVDSKTAPIFNLDTDAEKMAAIPFMGGEPIRAARAKATDNPAFRAPEDVNEAPLPSVYAAPKFAAYDKAGAIVGSNYTKYGDAETAAGTGGSVKILKQIEGQAQPRKKEKLHPEFWVSPDGKIIPAPSGHYDAAIDRILPKNWEPSTKDAEGKPVDPMGDLYPDVYAKGYVRALSSSPGSSDEGIHTLGPSLTSAQRKTLEALSFEHKIPLTHNDRPLDLGFTGQAQPQSGFIGYVDPDTGDIRAGRVPDLENMNHERLGYPDPSSADTFRYNDKTKTIYWWNKPEVDQETRDAVKAHIESKGFPVKYEKAIGADFSAKSYEAAHGQAQPFADPKFDDALDSIKSGAAGGHTFNPDGSIWTPTAGHPKDIVSLASVNVPAKDLTRENVVAALGPYADLLDEPNIAAGVFSFSKGGQPTVSIDLNAIVDAKHRENSMKFAKANDQVAIWDSAKNEEVPTGGKGETRLKSLGEITDALDNLQRGKPVDVDEIIRQNREVAPLEETPDMFGGKPVLGNAAQSNMTKAQLAAHFPESVIPRRREEPIPSDIKNSPLYKEAGSEPDAVKAFSRRLVEFAKEHADSAGFKSGSKWYSEFVPMLKKNFGADAPVMAELLAATSPQNAPEANYAYAVDALHGLKSGRFDKIKAKYEEGLSKLDDGTWKTWAKRAGLGAEPTPAAFLGEWIDKFDLKPRQSNGQLYGISSVPVLQVLARRWLANTSGPKTQNFVQNLLGTGHGATIDLWADRTMRRVGYSGLKDRWRILPKNATAVSDADFEFSQKAFAAAGKQLGMKPDALQGALWFAEKQKWASEGWSRLDLGDYRKEVPKTAALRAGVEQRLARTKAIAKVKPSEQSGLDLTVEPRNLK